MERFDSRLKFRNLKFIARGKRSLQMSRACILCLAFILLFIERL